ncbi:hypothetical protein Bca4012_066613 [Brassica carinata]
MEERRRVLNETSCKEWERGLLPTTVLYSSPLLFLILKHCESVIAFDNANAVIHSKLAILLRCTSTAAEPIRNKPESKQHSLAHDRVGSSGSRRYFGRNLSNQVYVSEEIRENAFSKAEKLQADLGNRFPRPKPTDENKNEVAQNMKSLIH